MMAFLEMSPKQQKVVMRIVSTVGVDRSDFYSRDSHGKMNPL